MSHVFHRNPAHVYAMAVSGDGAYLIDSSGKRYLDASGGAAVSCLGHSDHDVTAAIKAQLDRLAFAHTSFFTNSPMEMLATELVGRAPKGIGYAYFVSEGLGGRRVGAETRAPVLSGAGRTAA
jgi:adenosylmethionine-8-amino-7-oxononanoate aminotransferase